MLMSYLSFFREHVLVIFIQNIMDFVPLKLNSFLKPLPEIKPILDSAACFGTERAEELTLSRGLPAASPGRSERTRPTIPTLLDLQRHEGRLSARVTKYRGEKNKF